MAIIISILFWSIWRRLYGEGKFKKILNRTIQSIIAILVLSYQLCLGFTSISILILFGISAWVIFEYWSRSVGEILDAGLNHNQTAESYNRWFRIPLDYIYKICKKRPYRGFYDFWYSSIRYGIGTLPLIYYNWLAILLIPFQYFIYFYCYKLYTRYPKMFNWPLTINEPKNLAEVIHGALFGLIIALL